MAAGTPAGCTAGRSITAPPPHPWALPAVGAGSREGGARAWWMFLAPSRPRSLQRRKQTAHRVYPLLPGTASCRGLQGGFELGRIQVPPHPSANRGSRVLQAGSGAAGCCRACCAAGRGCCSGSRVSGTGWSTSPPGAAKPLPSLPPWAGRAGSGTQQCGKGWQGSTWGTPSAAPLAAQGCSSPHAGPGGGGGLLSLGFTRQVQPSGGGDTQPPTAGRERTARALSSEDPT